MDLGRSQCVDTEHCNLQCPVETAVTDFAVAHSKGHEQSVFKIQKQNRIYPTFFSFFLSLYLTGDPASNMLAVQVDHAHLQYCIFREAAFIILGQKVLYDYRIPPPLLHRGIILIENWEQNSAAETESTESYCLTRFLARPTSIFGCIKNAFNCISRPKENLFRDLYC